MSQSFVLAVARGRILQQTISLLGALDLQLHKNGEDDRRLLFKSNWPHLQIMVLRGSDVPTYVRHGAADSGIVGSDVLLEEGGADIYQPLDLKLARCRMMVAAKPGYNLPQAIDAGKLQLRVASKYPTISRDYFTAAGLQAEIIKLSGAMELAPLAGLADYIVDLVDSGATLRANGLVELAHIADISARLIVNKAALKRKQEPLRDFMERLETAVEKGEKVHEKDR